MLTFAVLHGCGGGGGSDTAPAPVPGGNVSDSSPPSVPANLVATGASGSVALSWSASTDNTAVAGYAIKREGTFLASTTATTYVDTNLPAATSHVYTVAARDAAGNVSADSLPATGITTDTIPPTAPSQLTATAAGAFGINLGWTAASDNVAVADYVVKRDGVPIGSTSGTTYDDAGLAPSTRYRYTVLARDAAGNVSAESTAADATTGRAADTTAPSVPTGLGVSGRTASSIALLWSASTDNVGVTGYVVRRNGLQVGTTTTTTFIDTGLASGGSYGYTVASRDGAGNVSADSAGIVASTIDTIPPSAPSTLTATANGASSIALAWSASTDNVGVATYAVFRNGVQVATTNTLAYTDTGLVSATAYTYFVQARDTAQNVSANSPLATATTLDGIAPTVPTGVAASATSSTGIRVSWIASTDNVAVTDYVVYRNGVQVGTSTTTSFQDTGLVSGTTYGYAVAARDAAGNQSASSPVVSAMTIDATPPSTPGNLAAIPAGPTSVNVSWSASTDNVGVTGYVVKRGGATIATVSALAYADNGLMSGLTYSYTVAARDAAGNASPDSASVDARTVDNIAPSVPASLVATVTGANAVSLAWNASTDNVGVTAYLIKRNGTQIATSTASTYFDGGLTDATTYTYTVSAQDAAGNVSANSAIASATLPDATAPTRPTGLTASAGGASTVNLAWSTSSDNVGVSVYIVKRNDVQVGTPSSPAFVDSGLSGSTTYSYTVAARDAAGNVSPESTSASATTSAAADTVPPSAPANLTATVAGTSTINLSWAASTDNVGVSDYVITRNGSQRATVSGTTFADTAVVAATLYTYTIVARDAAGNLSGISNSASTTIPDTVAPSVPTGVTATAAGASTINLAWNPSTDNVAVTGYDIRRNGALLTTTSATTYSDTGLISGATQSYTVAARDAAGNVSAQSASVDAKTQDNVAPSVPTGLQAVASGGSAVNLSWTASTDNVGVTGYRIRRNGAVVGTPAATTFQDAGLTNATPYNYTVSAGDAAGNFSAESSIVSVTTADTMPPTAPPGLVAQAAGGSTVNLTWSAASDNVAVTSYVVKRDGSQIGTTATTSFADTGLVSATTYAYTVAARDAAGNVSGDSAIVSASTADTVAPTVPGGLAAVAATGSATINLSWNASTDNVGITGYVVKRNGTQIATTVATNYPDTGLASATAYSYTVSAKDAAGNISADSSGVSATTADITPPTQPASLTATPAVAAATIVLSWSASSDNVGVTSYIVKRNGVQVATPTSTNFTDAGLAAATTYSYAVSARDAAGNLSAESTASATTAGTVFPLHVESGKRYLVDAGGKPFLMRADTAWSLIAELGNADTEQYLEDRRQKGFNAVIVSLIEHKYATHAPNNANNDPPFLTPGDFSTPNEAYFAHADQVIQMAASKGMLVLLVPAYLGFNAGDEGWYNEMAANGATKMQAYGAYVGQRYKNFSNILWVEGGDYNPPDKSLTRAVALGIQAAGSQGLHTAHAAPESSALAYWNGESWLQANSTYTYLDVPSQSQAAYSASTPFFLIESRYENEPDGTEQHVRVQAYQSMLAGAMGHAFGNNPIWHFSAPGLFSVSPSDWKQWLTSPATTSVMNANNLLGTRAWWTLVPDSTNILLTSGLGGPAYDRAVAAKAADGSFAFAYLPSARQVGINLAQMAGPRVTVRWFDPAAGTFTAVSGSPFQASSGQQFLSPPSGSNASTTGNFTDWVLVLESSQ